MSFPRSIPEEKESGSFRAIFAASEAGDDGGLGFKSGNSGRETDDAETFAFGDGGLGLKEDGTFEGDFDF